MAGAGEQAEGIIGIDSSAAVIADSAVIRRILRRGLLLRIFIPPFVLRMI